MVEEVNKEVKEFFDELVEVDTILMKLSIAIEVTLRNIEESVGFTRIKLVWDN